MLTSMADYLGQKFSVSETCQTRQVEREEAHELPNPVLRREL